MSRGMMSATTRELLDWLARVGVEARACAVEMSPAAVVWSVRACEDDIDRLKRYEEDIPLAFAIRGRAPLVSAVVERLDSQHARIAVRAMDARPAPVSALVLDVLHARVREEGRP